MLRESLKEMEAAKIAPKRFLDGARKRVAALAPGTAPSQDQKAK